MAEPRKSPRPAEYHKLGINEKRERTMGEMREPSVMCGECGMHVMGVDLPSHRAERCPGRREPGQGWKWVTYREAVQIVPERTFVRWVERGFVRVRGERGDRRYLHWDLASRVSLSRGFRRR